MELHEELRMKKEVMWLKEMWAGDEVQLCRKTFNTNTTLSYVVKASTGVGTSTIVLQ